MLVLVLGGGLRDDDVSALAGRGVGDRLVVVARAALATHVVEEQLAELERHPNSHRRQETNDQQTARPLVPILRDDDRPDLCVENVASTARVSDGVASAGMLYRRDRTHFDEKYCRWPVSRS